MLRLKRVRLCAGIAAIALAGAVPFVTASAATAASASPGPDTPTGVPQGISASTLPDASVFGTTPSDTPETVAFVLKENDQGQLESAVTHGIKNYLSVSQFAAEYGQSEASINALTGYLSGFGISTQVYADHVDVVATGTAGEFDSALSVSQQQYKVPEVKGKNGSFGIPAQTVHGTAQTPLLPYHLASFVTAILGLTDYGPFGSQAMHTDTSVIKPDSSSTNSCVQITGLNDGCHLPEDFASEYGLSSLYRKTLGSGQTIAIVTLAGLDVGAPEYYWDNIADIPDTGRTVSVYNVDGGPGAPSFAAGSSETDLDVEQSGGLAPGANIIVYQAPNTDYGFADAFFQAASQNIASTVSASWLESETYLEASIASGEESPGYEAAFDEAFLEMAAQGQSGFIAAGDWGAYTAHVDLGTTNLSVGASADSPYITAAGGTTLPWNETFTSGSTSVTVNVSQQRAWGWDYLWQPLATLTDTPLATEAESMVNGTGGGFSTIENTPSYQRGVSGTDYYNALEYLTPTDYQTVVSGFQAEPTAWSFNATPSLTTGYATGRAVPDVSTDADPYTGYLEWSPSFPEGGYPELDGGWGGTSFVAPQLNGATAVIDAYVGHRVGFWNPEIYSYAASGSDPFTPIGAAGANNDNLYYTGNPGADYNPATGLGTPNLSRLAADFAR
ncbi:MAG: S53 family peptidase [Streptosporangiaceae bacterium]|jgi:kumamolisin